MTLKTITATAALLLAFGVGTAGWAQSTNKVDQYQAGGGSASQVDQYQAGGGAATKVDQYQAGGGSATKTGQYKQGSVQSLSPSVNMDAGDKTKGK